MRRTLATVTAVTGFALVLSGCTGAGDGSDTAPTGAPGELSGRLSIAMNTGTEAQWNLMVENFEAANPDVDVEIEFSRSDTLSSLLNTQLTAGNAPDLFFARPGRGQAGAILTYAENGYVADLTDSPWAADLYEPVVDAVTYEDKVYAWLTDIVPQGYYYDMDEFDRLGLEPPTDFGDMLDLCEAISAEGKQPIALAMADPLWGAVLGVSRADQEVYSVDPEWNQKRTDGDTTFAESDEWRDSLQQIADMNEAGCFGDGAQGVAQDQAISTFVTNTSVMMFFPGFLNAAIKKANPDLNFGYFTLGADDADNSVVPVTLNAMIAMNSKAKNPDAARAFIDFIASAEQSTQFAATAGTVSPVDAANGILPETMNPTMAELFGAGRVQPQPNVDWPNPSVYLDALGQGVQGLFTGQRTVDQVLDDMDNAWG